MPLNNCKIQYANGTIEEGAGMRLSTEFGNPRICINHNVDTGYSRSYFGPEEYGEAFTVLEGELINKE